MTGEVKRILSNRAYGFITGEDTDYFFHKSDYEDLWLDLVDDLDKKEVVKVDFEVEKTSKGLRARKVMRVY